MKIPPIGKQGIIGAYEKNAARPVSAPATPLKGDQVEISGTAASFSAALRAASASMEAAYPERQAHIARVAEQVRSGSYSVPAQDIAGKILKGTHLYKEV